jgi:hypothetical protein
LCIISFFMSQSRGTIRRIVLVVAVMTTGLSAQRYTGHDHTVFHRLPQAPPPATKHQPSAAANATTSHQKPLASTQQGPRAGAAQGKLDMDLTHNSASAKTAPAPENTPRL